MIKVLAIVTATVWAVSGGWWALVGGIDGWFWILLTSLVNWFLAATTVGWYQWWRDLDDD